MRYIKDIAIILTNDEMNYVSGFDFDEESEAWFENNNVEFEYDTLFNRDCNGDPEHGTIYGYTVIKYNNKLWKCKYSYNNMSSHGNMDRGKEFRFNPVEAKIKNVVEYS